MYLKKKVLDLHVSYGMGPKSILRELGHGSRNTIRNIIREYESIKEKEGEDAAKKFKNSPPIFHTPERQRYKLSTHAIETIKAAIDSNAEKRKNNNRKQCVYIKRVWEDLVFSGENVSYPTVTKYAREYANNLPAHKDCHILQYHPAGEECQFDWGDIKLKINGINVKLKMAAFCLPHSNQRRGYLFQRENTLALMESHVMYLRDIGHIPRCMVYDNMRVAVKKFVGSEKKPTDALISISDFYGFTYRFCNKCAGNEKSYAENSVKVLRRDAFSTRDEFASIEEASKYLHERCLYLDSHPKSSKYSNIQQLISEDMNAMRPWTQDFGCYLRSSRKVNHMSLITVSHALYSVPDKYVNSKIDIKEYSNKIEIFDGSEKVAEHEKVSYDNSSIKLEHYLYTMSYKPGSVRNSMALKQAPLGIQKIFNESFRNTPKDFIEMLLYFKENNKSYEDIIEAYNRLKAKRVSHITFSLIKSVLTAEKEIKNDLSIPNNEITKQSELGLAMMSMLLGKLNGKSSQNSI